MDGFEKRKEQKKESIRRAALELFQSYGFRKVSIVEIARKAGVSQVTIYNHFGSKEAMVRDVILWFLNQMIDHYLEVMATDRPFAEKLEEMVFDKSRVAGQFQGELIRAYITESPDMQPVLDRLTNEKIMPAVESFFQQGIDQGYIDASFSREAIMLYFEIIRRGFYDHPDVVEHASTNPELVRELIRLITYGLNG